MYRLRLGINPGRADDAERAGAESGLERLLCCHTPENVPRGHEQNCLNVPAEAVIILSHDIPG